MPAAPSPLAPAPPCPSALRLDDDRERRGADPVRSDLRHFALALPLLLAVRDVVLPGAEGAAGGRDGEVGLDQVVASVAFGHVLELAALPELGDIGGQDDLHAGEPSLVIQPRTCRPSSRSRVTRPALSNVAGRRLTMRRTGVGMMRRTRDLSSSKAARGMPRRSSFSSISSLEIPDRKSSTPSTATTTSSSAPRNGIRSGMRSSGETA